MDHYSRQRAVANVGHALKALGWKLYGYKEDRSDSMTDYWDPESWRGIATKGDLVAAVYIKEYDARTYSGKPITECRPVIDGPCLRCTGGRLDPLGWTLEEARRNPRLFHSDQLRGRHQGATERGPQIDRLELSDGASIEQVFKDVVSPIGFDGSGRLKCLACKGAGVRHGRPEILEVDRHPNFMPNPRGRTWHVEKEGRILLSGVGLEACRDRDSRGLEAAGELALRIDSVGSASELEAGRQLSGGVTVTPNREKGGIEIRFPSKPPSEVLDRLKANGWRWSRFSGCWYNRDTPETRGFAEALA